MHASWKTSAHLTTATGHCHTNNYHHMIRCIQPKVYKQAPKIARCTPDPLSRWRVWPRYETIDETMEIMGCHAISFRYATKLEVLELLKRSGYTLRVMVVAGGIWATPCPSSKARENRPFISREAVEKRHLKAKAFQSKVCTMNCYSTYSPYIRMPPTLI